MALTLAERLAKARRGGFVGRTAERSLFKNALTAEELPFQLLFVYGPGGIGKTTLLREYLTQSQKLSIPAIYLDGRNLDPSPGQFLQALQETIGQQTPATDYLAQSNQRQVLVLDTYENLVPIDSWLRDRFLPQLSANILVVFAGRNPPTPPWRDDPGWQAVMHLRSLRNLTQEEGRTYLTNRQVPTGQHQAILNFTHAHPLALSLVADAFAQQPDSHFAPSQAPDIIKNLIERLVANVPSPAHRQALEACAQVRLLTEPLLAALLQQPDVHDLFDWLRALSFIESEQHGLFPHDLAREALTADLRWRNPDWYKTLHERARTYYMARVQQGQPQEQRLVLSHYIFLHRHNPMVQPYFEWQTTGSVFTDKLRPEDQPHLLTMVRAHESETAVQIATHWLNSPASTTSVFRETVGQTQGFLTQITLAQTTAQERQADPAVQAAWDYLQQQAPLRPGEQATYFRFWMAADSYQTVSPVQSRIFLNIIQHYLTTPGLAYTFLSCANPDFWTDIFAYANLSRIPQAAFTIDHQTYGVFGHDWRSVPPMTWLQLMGERELASSLPPKPVEKTAVLLVLSKSDFKTAVRSALRNYTQPDLLADNPLLQSKLIAESEKTTDDDRTAVLRQLLEETALILNKTPKQAKWYRALHHTYFQPAPTQEKAAELLDIPFSTYRRHLRSALDFITQRLWQQEIGNPK